MTAANTGPYGGIVNDPRNLLRQRPSIEEISERYEQMQQRLLDRLNMEVGPLEWAVSDPVSRAGCTEFPDVREAESRVLESWRAPGNLPDSEWSLAVEIVQEITGEYGFDEPEIIVNRSGDHEIIGNDQYGAVYQFGTAANTVLMITTGCHLLAAAKD
ncbi:LppA family lipoprotein [Saccharopolyspora shandongensis]|uniref:Lipoprotein n=1 Tax=Saccharopolyspora shandongensis TaxID=418495 RepID=A0A1H3PP22_9PSEU|nr:LppA family lipoprotein [Saccharopolyspora shandongensis]SDZ02720.1 Lipoprotein [Saccharopolyspora shandongensis]